MAKDLYSEDHKYLVKRLREARINAGLDQLDVARILNRTQSYISKIESGQRKIDAVQLKELAKIYKKPITFFLGNNNEKTK